MKNEAEEFEALLACLVFFFFFPVCSDATKVIRQGQAAEGEGETGSPLRGISLTLGSLHPSHPALAFAEHTEMFLAGVLTSSTG